MHSYILTELQPAPLFAVFHYWTNRLIQVCLIVMQNIPSKKYIQYVSICHMWYGYIKC